MTKVLIAIVVVLVLAGGGFALANRHKNTPVTTTTDTSTMHDHMASNSPTTSNNSSSSSTPAATDSVTIDNFAFSPADITVKAGATVTWTNKDSVTHTVTETDSLKGPDSGNLASGKTYSFTFTAAGTYHYHCSIHPEMLGTVTVTQ